ncbi:MAG: ester cyclase [Saprospiraceae bacterium]|nr:ester cyclase [Saprospiraceae bacterium]
MTNVESNKLLVKRYINEIVNTGLTDSIAEFIDDNYTEIYDGSTYHLGISGAIDHIKGVRNTYPDLNIAIDHQIGEGNWVATSYIMSGTHSGEWMGIRPTFKKIKVTGVNLDCIVNGKIIEHSGAANLLQPLIEIGAVSIR